MAINLCESWESLCLVCAVIQTCHNISATHYTLHILMMHTILKKSKFQEQIYRSHGHIYVIFFARQQEYRVFHTLIYDLGLFFLFSGWKWFNLYSFFLERARQVRNNALLFPGRQFWLRRGKNEKWVFFDCVDDAVDDVFTKVAWAVDRLGIISQISKFKHHLVRRIKRRKKSTRRWWFWLLLKILRFWFWWWGGIFEKLPTDEAEKFKTDFDLVGRVNSVGPTHDHDHDHDHCDDNND